MLSTHAGLPFVMFVAYVAVSMLMVNDPSRPLLPQPLGGKVQLSEVVFPFAIGVWLVAGAPSLGRVARATGMPAAVWVAANVATAAVAVWPGAAWRETGAFVYLGLVAAAWATFWGLYLRSMWSSMGQGLAGMLARYQAVGCGAVLLTSIHLDVMRFRFLWVSMALGLAAAVCARKEVPG